MYSDLQLDPWLKDGERHTPTLPDLARFLAAIEPRPQRILDTGCGSGELLRLLLSEGFPPAALYGIDIEPDHAELARRRTGLPDSQIVCGCLTSDTIFRTPPGGCNFNIITAINWLQTDWPNTYAVKAARLPPDPLRLERFLDNCRRFLVPGGLLVWDWHTTSEAGFLELLSRLGWTEARPPLRFEQTNYPEKYPIYFYKRD